MKVLKCEQHLKIFKSKRSISFEIFRQQRGYFRGRARGNRGNYRGRRNYNSRYRGNYNRGGANHYGNQHGSTPQKSSDMITFNPQPHEVDTDKPSWQKLELFLNSHYGKSCWHNFSYVAKSKSGEEIPESDKEKIETYTGTLIINDKLFQQSIPKEEAGDDPSIKLKELLTQSVFFAYGNTTLDIDDDNEMINMFINLTSWSALTQVNQAFPRIKFKNIFIPSLSINDPNQIIHIQPYKKDAEEGEQGILAPRRFPPGMDLIACRNEVALDILNHADYHEMYVKFMQKYARPYDAKLEHKEFERLKKEEENRKLNAPPTKNVDEMLVHTKIKVYSEHFGLETFFENSAHKNGHQTIYQICFK